MAGDGTSCSAAGSSVWRSTRSSSGSRRSWPNHFASSGWWTSTGDRVVGRSTPGVGDAGADQGVDQRRLAGAGRAADDREQRRVEGHQARDHVVLELVDHLGAGAALLVGPGELERQPGLLQGAAQAHQRGHHRRRGVGGTPLLGDLLGGLVRSLLGGLVVGPVVVVGHRVGTTCPGKEM